MWFLPRQTDDKMGLDKEWCRFKISEKIGKAGGESPFLSVVYGLRPIDKGKIEAPESCGKHLIQRFSREIPRIKTIHRRQCNARISEALKYVAEKGNVKIEHIVFKINRTYPKFNALSYFFFDTLQSALPVRYRRFPAKRALAHTA